jgi:trimethylamine---corrinoid protein Co-methyltransferase
MTTHGLRTTALDQESCDRLHAATVTVLERTGVEVQHEEALAMLAKAGARVDGTRVRIPGALVDEAIAAAPHEVQLSSRGGADAVGEPLVLRSGQTYFGTGSDCLYISGPGARDRRPVTLDDVEQMAVLQEKLTQIDFVMSMAHPSQVPSTYVDAAQFAAMLRATSKPLLMVTPNALNLDVMMEMATACGGAGSWGIYAMPTPPLVHGRDSVELLIGCARLGVPMAYANAILQGATAPASRAGFVIHGNAETLSGLVIAQLAAAGAPYVYGVAQGSMNLRTSSVLYAAPESYAIQQACADMARFYGLPSFGYGGVSDSPMLDEQWALEAGTTLLANALAGVTLLHDLGYLASGTASSYEAVVLMDQMVSWVKAYLGGVSLEQVDEAVEEIDAVGPAGTHLNRKFTRRHYRDWLTPSLLSQQPYDAWVAAGGTTLLERVADRTRELRSAERDFELGSDAAAELDRLLGVVRSHAGD